MDKNTFIADAKKKRKETVEPLTLEVLSKMLKDDIKYLDTHYVQDRSLEILEKTLGKLKYDSDTILKARRAFLDVLLDGAQKQLYGFKDDYELAKENVKIKSEKAKALEVLRMIERLEGKVPQDATEQRNMECEPVCQMIASKLISKEIILKDEAFVNGCIEMDNDMLMTTLYRPIFEELFDQVISSLDNSYKIANEKHWGVPRDKIKLSQIDRRIKE